MDILLVQTVFELWLSCCGIWELTSLPMSSRWVWFLTLGHGSAFSRKLY